VLTVHRSKGLEFPVVYAPFLWEPGYIPREPHPVCFHDPGRVLDVALEGRDYERHRAQELVEQRGEDLRLAYVALTRARHRAVVWWAPAWHSQHSPLGRLLFARDQDGNVAASGKRTPSDATVIERFQELAGQCGGQIDVERSKLGRPAEWISSLAEPRRLGHAEFKRRLDLSWRRTSYTDITAGAYEAAVSSEPDETLVSDEPGSDAVVPAIEIAPPGAARSLLAEMPAGAQVGTLVHRVLAATDFAAADIDAALAEQIDEAQSWRAVELGDRAGVVAGLRAAIETPLGPVLGGGRLMDVGRGDRLDELEFELPLVGGDRPTGALTLDLIADVLRRCLPAGDPLAGYADRLSDEALRQSVHGYMTGSLDLVVRLPGDGVPRFAVIDYKTNWLAGPDEELTLWHHRPEALIDEMLRRHYALQALLYTVALHRYLRWRLPDYDPDRNLAGVLYLFLRGMAGAGTPTVDRTPYGVFAWRPTGPLVEALSDALDGGVVAG
jgi:exodeoxyribonuclease V beta subunit